LKASETFPLFISLEVNIIEKLVLTGILVLFFCTPDSFSFEYNSLNIELLLKIFWLSSVKTRYLGISKIEFNLSITDGDGYSIPFNIIFFPKIKHFEIIPNEMKLLFLILQISLFYFFFEYYPLFL
jgi:hypothetical protein